jgi:hypothetical protein
VATGNGTPTSERKMGNKVMVGEEVRVSFALLLRLSVAMLWYTYIDSDAITRRTFVRKRVESSHWERSMHAPK